MQHQIILRQSDAGRVLHQLQAHSRHGFVASAVTGTCTPLPPRNWARLQPLNRQVMWGQRGAQALATPAAWTNTHPCRAQSMRCANEAVAAHLQGRDWLMYDLWLGGCESMYVLITEQDALARTLAYRMWTDELPSIQRSTPALCQAPPQLLCFDEQTPGSTLWALAFLRDEPPPLMLVHGKLANFGEYPAPEDPEAAGDASTPASAHWIQRCEALMRKAQTLGVHADDLDDSVDLWTHVPDALHAELEPRHANWLQDHLGDWRLVAEWQAPLPHTKRARHPNAVRTPCDVWRIYQASSEAAWLAAWRMLDVTEGTTVPLAALPGTLTDHAALRVLQTLTPNVQQPLNPLTLLHACAEAEAIWLVTVSIGGGAGEHTQQLYSHEPHVVDMVQQLLDGESAWLCHAI